MATSVGNILDVTEGVIVQQVNCQGVMGSGIAKAIRDKWPVVWDQYSEFTGPPYCQKDSGAGLLGLCLVTCVAPKLIVANVFGQQFFRRQGTLDTTRFTSYDALDIAFTELAKMFSGLKAPIHYPLIGSDRGGAHWPIVKAIIDHRLKGLDHRLWLLPGVNEPT